MIQEFRASFTSLSHAMLEAAATLDVAMSDVAVGRRRYSQRPCSSGGDLAPSLGERTKFSRTKISEMTIFSGKNVHFHAQNF